MQSLYDRGIYTGWALVVEMIERGDIKSLPELATHLTGIYQNKIDDRLQLVVDHAYSMHKTLTLPKNAQKGGWKGMDTATLISLLDKEIEEFYAALWACDFHGGAPERVAEEASDMSNFAAMIVDNCRTTRVSNN